MLHLIDSNEKFKLGAIWQLPRANCGLRMDKAKVKFKNDWFRGQCAYWLDKKEICDACRIVAQLPNPDDKFTYAVEESK